jgi:membrane protein
VEWSFNRIWGVQRARGLLRTASDYMLITLLLPFGAAFVLGINAALENPALVEMLGTLSYGLRLIQLLLICLIFSLLYWLVPNTRVEIPYALLGGVVAGILWMLLAWAYVKFQFGLPRYTLFFSTFALIPLLLMWIYSSWLILLFGALLSFAYQNEKTFAMERWVDRASFAYREMLALRVMIELTRRFLYGLAPWPAATLAAALNVPSRLLNETLVRLEESGLVLTCAGDPPTYVPGRAPETIRVRHVLDALRYAGEEPSLLRQEPGFRSLYERLRAWDPTVLDCPLTDWLRETDKDAQTNAVPSTGRDAMEGANRNAVD